MAYVLTDCFSDQVERLLCCVCVEKKTIYELLQARLVQRKILKCAYIKNEMVIKLLVLYCIRHIFI